MRRNTGQFGQIVDFAKNSRLSGLSDHLDTFLVPQNSMASSSGFSADSWNSNKQSSKSIISGFQKRRFAQNMKRLQRKYKQRKSLEADRGKSAKVCLKRPSQYSRQDKHLLRREDSYLTVESDLNPRRSKLKSSIRLKGETDLQENLGMEFQTHISQNSKDITKQTEPKNFLPLNQITQINEELLTTRRLSKTRMEEETEVKYEFDLEEDDQSRSISLEQSDSTYSEGQNNIVVQTYSYESRKDLVKQVHRLRELKQYSRCLILPDDPWAVRWNFILMWQDVAIFRVIIGSSIITPMRAAFFDEDELIWTLLETFIDLIYFLDIVFTFFSAYYNRIEELISNRKQIAWGYLKSWFFLDVISVIPLSLFFSSASNKFGKLAKLPRIYQIVKTTKFMRVLKAVKARTRLRRNISSVSNLEIERILIFLFVFVLLCHNLSCLWFLVAKVQEFNELTWVSRYELVEASVPDQYLACLYFIVTTITTVGYGDITSKSPAQQGFCIILMLIGVISYSMAISSFTSVISDSNRKQKLLVGKLNVLSLLRDEYHLSLDLYWRLRQSLHYEHSMDMSEKQDFVRELPPKLRVELSNIMYTHQLNGVRFFENKSAGFVAALAPKLKPVKACKGDYLFMKGDALDGIYFIKQGQASYVQRCPNADLIFATNRPGSYFGDIEFSMINEEAEPTRFFTLKARTDLDLLFLPKQDLYDIDNHFRTQLLSLFERSLSHLDKLKNMNRRSEMWLEKRYSAPQGNQLEFLKRNTSRSIEMSIEARGTPRQANQRTPRNEAGFNEWNREESFKAERTRKTLKEELAFKKIAYQERKSRKKTLKKMQKEGSPKGAAWLHQDCQPHFNLKEIDEERKSPQQISNHRKSSIVPFRNKNVPFCISTETSLDTEEGDVSTHRALLAKIARKATSHKK